jgi:ABC-2 type transport system ATP-binding protein
MSRVDGLDPWRSRSAALERIAYLPQTPALYRDLTIEDHFAVVQHYRPTFEIPTARKWLSRLAINPQARPRELSGGQVAQVGLAIALGSHAPVLLLDEPLASLDPLARHEFPEVLREASATDHSTVVLSSHNIGDIAQVCDWIVVLGAGLKSLDSSMTEVLAQHHVVSPNADLDGNGHLIGPLPDGRLVVMGDGHEGGNAANLEEIVLAYLAMGRVAADATVALAS